MKIQLPNIVPGTAPPLRTRRMMMGPAGIRPHISNNKSSWPIAPAPVRSRTVLSPSSLRPARRSPGPSRSSSVVASSSSSNSSRGGHLKSPLQQQTTTIKQAAAVGSSIAEENDENVLFPPSTSSYPLTMATVKKCVHFEQSPTRTSSMMSHMTFVVDNNSRRPLLVATGLSKSLFVFPSNIQYSRNF